MATEVVHCLRPGSEAPRGAVRPATRPEEAEPGRSVLACAFCRRPITTTGARIEVDGAHEHTFTNPHGIRFRIGCFAQATGCRTLGGASTFWTWFPGHAWQIEQCGQCREHLGWLFTAPRASFHGLVLDRLVALEDGS